MHQKSLLLSGWCDNGNIVITVHAFKTQTKCNLKNKKWIDVRCTVFFFLFCIAVRSLVSSAINPRQYYYSTSAVVLLLLATQASS